MPVLAVLLIKQELSWRSFVALDDSGQLGPSINCHPPSNPVNA